MSEKYVLKRPAYLDLASARGVLMDGALIVSGAPWKTQPRDDRGRFARKPGGPETVADLSGAISVFGSPRMRSRAQEAREEIYRSNGLHLTHPEISDEDLLTAWEQADPETQKVLGQDLKRRMAILQKTDAAIQRAGVLAAREEKRERSRERFDELLDVIPGGGAIKALRERLQSDPALDLRDRFTGFVKRHGPGWAISVATATSLALVFSPMLGSISLGVFAGRNVAQVLQWPPVAAVLEGLSQNYGMRAGRLAFAKLAARSARGAV